MTKGAPKNIAASVRQRLLDLARHQKEDFQLVLSRYALERLLYRISQSSYQDRFIVKGAMLFQLWTDQPYRPTRDIDLLAQGDHSVKHLEFHDDDGKQKQWKAFITKGGLATATPNMPDLIASLRLFLMPPIEAIRTQDAFRQMWKPPGPWRPKT